MIVASISVKKIRLMEEIVATYLEKKASEFDVKDPRDGFIIALKSLLDARFHLDIMAEVHHKAGDEAGRARLDAVSIILNNAIGIILLDIDKVMDLRELVEKLDIQIPNLEEKLAEDDRDQGDLLPY